MASTSVRVYLLRRWFSLGIQVSSTNKNDHHDITEILLKVALNTITLSHLPPKNTKLILKKNW
jgi:hypothetical protein